VVVRGGGDNSSHSSSPGGSWKTLLLGVGNNTGGSLGRQDAPPHQRSKAAYHPHDMSNQGIGRLETKSVSTSVDFWKYFGGNAKCGEERRFFDGGWDWVVGGNFERIDIEGRGEKGNDRVILIGWQVETYHIWKLLRHSLHPHHHHSARVQVGAIRPATLRPQPIFAFSVLSSPPGSSALDPRSLSVTFPLP